MYTTPIPGCHTAGVFNIREKIPGGGRKRENLTT